MSCKNPSILLFFLISLISASRAAALYEGVTITEITTNTGNFSYKFYDWAALNESGEVCFRGADNSRSAILKGDGSVREVIAATDDGSGLYDAFVTGMCSINDQGDVAYDACLNCEPIIPGAAAARSSYQTLEASQPIVYTVYKASKTQTGYILSALQTSGQNADDFKTVSLPIINSLGQVLFVGEKNNSLKGIFVKSGSDLLSPIDTSGIFAEIGGAFMNDSQQLTFGAAEDINPTQNNIYGPAVNPIIGGFNGFSKLSLPMINNTGSVVALALQSTDQNGQNGVFVNGQPVVLNAGDFQSVDVSSFQAVSMNDSGEIVFPAIRPNGNSAVFLLVSGGMITLIETGDLLPGRASPVALATVGREALNNKRQIALVVILQDGTELVARFDASNIVLPNDLCPTDNIKFNPGQCGCGVSDADSNSDGILDCFVLSTLKTSLLDLGALLKKLKPVSSSASKIKKKTAKKLAKDIRALLKFSVNLMNGSTAQIQLLGGTKSVAQHAAALRRSVNKALKTSLSDFPKNKKTAMKTLNSLLKVV